MAAIVTFAACQVPGPVTQGPHNTASVQRFTEKHIDNNTKALVRCILAKYEEKLARMWRVWERNDEKLRARTPDDQGVPADKMTPAQLKAFYEEVATQRIRVALARDNKLADYDRTRAAELAQAAANSDQAKAGVANLIESWRRQGEVSQWTSENILNVFEAGLEAYQQVQHIRNLRKEAEQAAKAKEAEEAELEVKE